MAKGRRSRIAVFLRLLRTAPDQRGAGIARTLVLSVVVGVCAGLGAVLLSTMLQLFDWTFLGSMGGWLPEGAAHEPHPLNLPPVSGPVRRWAVALLPALGGLISGWFVQRFAPEAAGHGTDAAIEAYHFRGGRVRPVAIPVKALATTLLIGTGGSAGCEGPITQIGAGIGSLVGSALRLPVASRRKLMAAGMGAGVGALFHAPLAGALFAAELLYRDLDLEYEVLVPSIVASVTSYTVYSRVFGFCPLFDTPENSFGRPHMLLLYIVLALVLVQGARFYTWAFWTAHERFSRLRVPVWLRPAIGGLATGLVGCLFLPALGSGYGTIQDALRFDDSWTLPGHGAAFALLLGVFFAKTATTAFSVGSGGSGGIFGPALVCGGALGGAVGMVFATILPSWNVNPGSFVLVGMVAFFGCAAKTPISMILMIGEMTGNYRLLVPSMWVVVIAYLLTRKVSLYRSQLPNRFEAPVHRSAVVSGTLGCITVRDVLASRRRRVEFTAVTAATPLSTLFDKFSRTGQAVFPVVAPDGSLAGVVGRRELDAVVETDPVFRQTMLVGDLVLSAHPVVTGPEPLRKVLSKMDDDDAEAIVVVDGPASRRRAVAVLDHNDIAAAYRAEIATSR